MKPGFHLWMLKPKSSQSSGCIPIHQTIRKSLNRRYLPARGWWQLSLGQERDADGGFMQHGTTVTSEVYCVGPTFRNKRRGMLTYGVVSSMTMRVRMQLLALEHCWGISTRSCFTTLLTALISLHAATTYLPTWRSGWDHGASAIRSWWNLSKRGWAHRRQNSLIQAYKNLFPYKSASIPAVITLRSSLSMYVILI
jgi:hypothetical protein